MRRAFSLFTPLVGTSVMIIAIIVASAMVQNDVRMSRGLSSSYEQTSQVISSKTIQAAANIQMIQNMEKQTETILKNGLTVTCSGSVNDCEQKMSRAYFTNPNSLLRSQMLGGAGGLYDGMIKSIEAVSAYEPVSRTCTVPNGADCNQIQQMQDRFDCCLSKALANANPEAIKTGYDSSGRIAVSIQNSYLKETQVVEGFSVDFQNSKNNLDKITLSIVPNDFTYTSVSPIRGRITRTAEAVNYLYSKSDGVMNPVELNDIKTHACNRLSSSDASFTFVPTGLSKSNLIVKDYHNVPLSTGTEKVPLTFIVEVNKPIILPPIKC